MASDRQEGAAGRGPAASTDVVLEPAVAVEVVELPGPPPPSLAINSVSRLAADVAGLVLGMVAAVITARWLGPAGKGVLSTLTFLAGIFMLACTAGLGDAAIVQINTRKVSFEHSARVTLLTVLALSLLGALLFLLIVWLTLPDIWEGSRSATLVSALSIPVATYFTVLTQVINARERIVLTSAAALLSAGVSAIGLLVLVVVLDRDVVGAVVAGLIGTCAGVALLLALMPSRRSAVLLAWDSSYLRRVIGYGSAVLISSFFVTLSARLDLLLVYWLGTRAEAGQYSVALTLGQLVSFGALAIVYAGFPRIAGLEAREAQELVARLFRVGMASAAVAAVGLAAAIPLAVSVLFGDDYTPSIAAGLILLPGGVCFAGQLILARGAAARGRPRLLVESFGASVTAMIALDLFLIPLAGVNGAALGSSLSSVIGLLVCLAGSRRAFGPSVEWSLMPRIDDLRFLGETLARTLRRGPRPGG